jgi:hypothetical protein
VKGQQGAVKPLQVANRNCYLYSGLNDEQFKKMTMDNINYYNHRWAVSPELYTVHPILEEFFDITAYG